MRVRCPNQMLFYLLNIVLHVAHSKYKCVLREYVQYGSL
jgi:hypothetical protein